MPRNIRRCTSTLNGRNIDLWMRSRLHSYDLIATIFGPPARASTTMRYSKDLWGSEKETPGVTPETKSLILLIATLESRRKASAFFFWIPLFFSASPRFSYFESSSALWNSSSSFSSASYRFLRCFSVEGTRVEPWDERIDDDCREPKINHVFFRVQGEAGERGKNREQTVPEKEGTRRLAATR